jgi:hypothetical protein
VCVWCVCVVCGVWCVVCVWCVVSRFVDLIVAQVSGDLFLEPQAGLLAPCIELCVHQVRPRALITATYQQNLILNCGCGLA